MRIYILFSSVISLQLTIQDVVNLSPDQQKIIFDYNEIMDDIMNHNI